VILAELPVPHPEEVVRIQAARRPFDQSWTISYPAYQHLRASTPDVPLMVSAYAQEATLDLPNRAPIEAACPLLSDNYFSGLGIAPATGRLFVQADERMGQGEWPVVLRYDFASNTFGSAQQAVGQHILLNDRAFVVIGVAHRSSSATERDMFPTSGRLLLCKAQAYWPFHRIRSGRAIMYRLTSLGITSPQSSGWCSWRAFRQNVAMPCLPIGIRHFATIERR
jgi:hypothetical protein